MPPTSRLAVRFNSWRTDRTVRRPTSFYSKKLKSAETRYSAFGRELLAAYLVIRLFRHVLEGCYFPVLTDHKPLTYAAYYQNSDIYRYSIASLQHLPSAPIKQMFMYSYGR